KYPIIGVNTFLSSTGSPTVTPGEVIRATEEEKQNQIKTLRSLHEAKKELEAETLEKVKNAAIQNENIFEVLMEATKVCSLGLIPSALFEVGGKYRRNM